MAQSGAGRLGICARLARGAIFGMPCSAATPTPCPERRKARHEVWYGWLGGTWIWATGEFIVPITHCPFCGGSLPLMGTDAETRAWLDGLGNPEE